MASPAIAPPDLTISKAPLEPALEQPQLYTAGLEEIRRLAGYVWTDHNVHDPGVTTLEVTAYAVTDVAFRATQPVEDLLATAADNPQNMARQFPSARTILPNRPVTIRDYRKLLIDLPGVRNAWLKPAPLTYYVDRAARKLLAADPGRPGIEAVAVRGIYDVRIDFTDAMLTPEQQGQVLRQARAVLHANRNLCEDFNEPQGIVRQEFQICGELELEPGREVDASLVQARIFFEVQQYLAPAVANYSLAEMLAASKAEGSRYQVDDLFNGPPLTNGFIKDDEVDRADLRTVVRLSDVINIVMDIPGVRAVRDLIVAPAGAGQLPDKWLVPVATDRQPTLARSMSRLVYYKDGVPVAPSKAKVEAEYEKLSNEATAKLETPRPEDLPIPLGRARLQGRYYSFQNHFPATYGIGEEGLEPTVGPRRQALARQLKGYLLFFDQILANACAQLENLAALFATDPAGERTYFYQAVDTVRGFERLYDVDLDPLPAGETIDSATRKQALASLETRADEAPAVHDDRRHRFLDHLIARYAERFHEYASAVQAAIGTSSRALRRHKCRFLRSYPQVGGQRGSGYDYTVTPASALWNSANVSGLERRLALLLDLGDPRRRDISVVPEDANTQVFQRAVGDQRFRIVNDAGDVILQAPFGFATLAEARAAMHRALETAQVPSAYVRHINPDGTGTFTIKDAAGVTVAESGGTSAGADALDRAIDDAVELVRMRYGREALYVIENLLLRSQDDAHLLDICSDARCTGCADDDPYSYRVHVILPADAGRFRNMAFREFAESVIRAETPAHILPKICWIGAEDQQRVEDAYRAWLEAGPGPGGVESPDAEAAGALRRLIDALQEAKNVYPEARLADCDSPESIPRFLLGRQALGDHEHDE